MALLKRVGGVASAAGKRLRAVLRRLNPVPFLRGRAFGIAWRAAVAAGAVFVVLLVHRRIFSSLEGIPAYHYSASTLTLKVRPAWASADPQIVVDIAPDLKGEASLLNPRLVPYIAERLKADPWVRRVVRVERRYGDPSGGVRVRLEIREPYLVVERREGYFLVDRDGVRLPGQYARRPCLDPGVPVYPVRGIPGPVPVAGARWEDPGILAAVDVADVLGGYGVGGMVSTQAIDVSNIGGRVDRREPEILIWAEQGVAIRWGRPRTTEAYGEPDVRTKLQSLAMVLRQYPRLGGLASVDVRFMNRDGSSPVPVVRPGAPPAQVSRKPSGR